MPTRGTLLMRQQKYNDRYFLGNMMKQAEKKSATRSKLVDAAGRGFRTHGFSGVGVDSMAGSAGATSGAFYAHLGSKGKAFHIALTAGLDEVIEAIPQYQLEHGSAWIDAFSDYYLGKPHRLDMACGCAMTTLTPDVMRGDEAAKEIYETRMNEIAELISGGLTKIDLTDRMPRAWSILQTLIGGLMMARSMHTEDASDRVAQATKAAVRILAAANTS